jgi:hypothetical protein
VVGESTHVAVVEGLAVSFGYDLSELGSEELEYLMEELQKSGGVPSTEPRSTVITPASGGTP